MQGKAAEALPQVEARLAQVEAWWQQHRSGQTVPEAPDAEFLARALISALDIARDAHFAQEDWEPALRRIDAILEVKRALKRPAEDIAIDSDEPRQSCWRSWAASARRRPSWRPASRSSRTIPPGVPAVLSSLASLFDEQGDVPQAITQQRRALALREQLPDPSDRAISHNNLANYLERSGTPSALAESPRHQLAALVYRLVSGLGQDLQTSLRNYAIVFRRAQAAGTPLAVPRLAELLADPAFRPLDDWLRQRQADVAEVQAAVDQFLEHGPAGSAWNRSKSTETFITMLNTHKPTTAARRTAHRTRSRRPRRRSRSRHAARTDDPATPGQPRRPTAPPWNAASAP